MVKKLMALLAVVCLVAVAGLAVSGSQAQAKGVEYRAKLRDPQGRLVGDVTFNVTHHAMYVEATLRPNSEVAVNQFHGFHIHANNNPANGDGCIASTSQPSSTWFVSADGHLSEPGQVHSQHTGDFPSPLVLADGTARIAFTTDRIEPAVLRRTAVILHKGVDNFGNVPTGTNPTDYTPNDQVLATDLTDRTGNAGDRAACGLVRRSWAW